MVTSDLTLSFTRPPSAVGYMARALYPSAGFVGRGDFPALQARWAGHRINRRHLAEFLRLTGLPAEHGLSVLYPQVSAFRLQMVILTHSSFPLPIWTALQVRNHLVRHHPIPLDAPLDIETSVARHRILEKAIEVDLHTCLRSGTTLLWEGLTTFYYRGRYAGTDTPSSLSRSPEAQGDAKVTWSMRPGGGWRFGWLTGDYNGLHYWSWYARRFGFPRAFYHPQRVVGACLARLRAPIETQPQRLDIWLKAPVYYGSQVQLRAADGQAGSSFALHVAGSERPAILGCWSGGSSVRGFDDSEQFSPRVTQIPTHVEERGAHPGP